MGKQNMPPPAIDAEIMGWEQSATRMGPAPPLPTENMGWDKSAGRIGTGTRPTIVQEKLEKEIAI